MVRCARCGRPDCPGCAIASPPAARSVAIAWESDGAFGRRLWQTALATSTDPERAFGELPEGRVLTALGFAIAAELFAIGSFAIAAALVLFAFAPELSARV